MRSKSDGNVRASIASTPPFSPAANRAAQSAARNWMPNRGATIVRLILGITLLLLGVGLLSCNVEGTANSGPTSPPAVRQWVRTTNGWERASAWHAAKAPRPRLHPLVVAAGQGLVSVLGLVAFRRDER